jgi:hypothetical protein
MIAANLVAPDDPFTIEVKNTTGDPAVLDDLTVFGPIPQAMIILQKGSSTKFSANEVKSFDNIPFEPQSVSFSLSNGSETNIFKLGKVSKDVSMLINPADNSPLFLAIDASQAGPIPPDVGAVLAYSNGLNTTTPGWFVGTAINDATGEVTNPYTGSAEVFDNTFAFTILSPEPSGTVSVLLAVAVLLGTKRRLNSRFRH